MAAKSLQKRGILDRQGAKGLKGRAWVFSPAQTNRHRVAR
jgi:hypothetical protein